MLKRRKLAKLGRRINEYDHEYVEYVMKECGIDPIAGFGYDLAQGKGKKEPRPYRSTHILNTVERWKFKIPVTLLSLHMEGISPAFFFCDPASDNFTATIDCDNKWKLPVDEFEEEVNLLIYLLDMEGVYVDRSTGRSGFHLYFKLNTQNIDCVQEIKELLKNLERYCNQTCKDNDLKIHVDVTGHPAVYDEQGKVIKYGTLQKVPFNLHDPEVRIAFEKRRKFEPEFFDDMCGIGPIKKEQSKENKEIQEQAGSIITKPNLDLIPDIIKYFEHMFGDSYFKINEHRDKISAEEFAYYVLAISLASRRAEKSTPERAEWKDTLPENAIKAAYKTITEEIKTNKYNERKYRWVRHLLELYDLINIIDKSYKPTVKDEEGNIVILGVGAKWRVKQAELVELFKEEKRRGGIYVSNNINGFKGTLFELAGILEVDFSVDYPDFCFEPEFLQLSC